MKSLLTFLAVALLAVAAPPVYAFDILLDIDTDNDPTTINEITFETSAVVKLILAPDFPGEEIGRVDFGLGGSCQECDLVHYYGTSHDLIDFDVPLWAQASGIASGWDYATSLGCPGDPGYHLVLWFEPLAGTIELEQPVVLAEFNAWVAPPTPAGCPQPASNLAAMSQQGEYWNYIQINGPAIDVRPSPWGRIKAMFR